MGKASCVTVLPCSFLQFHSIPSVLNTKKRVVLVGLTSDQEGDSVKTKRKSETRIFQQT